MRPVYLTGGVSNRMSRTAECTPSAPTTASAVTVMPSAKVRRTPSAASSSPTSLWFSRTHSAGTALASDHVELDFAGPPVAVVPGARIEGLAAHALLQPKPAQHLHGVTADLDAG